MQRRRARSRATSRRATVATNARVGVHVAFSSLSFFHILFFSLVGALWLSQRTRRKWAACTRLGTSGAATRAAGDGARCGGRHARRPSSFPGERGMPSFFFSVGSFFLFAEKKRASAHTLPAHVWDGAGRSCWTLRVATRSLIFCAVSIFARCRTRLPFFFSSGRAAFSLFVRRCSRACATPGPFFPA